MAWQYAAEGQEAFRGDAEALIRNGRIKKMISGFARRLQERRDELEWLYMELYDRRDMLDTLLERMGEAYRQREQSLRRLDARYVRRGGDILLLRTFDEARDKLISGHFYAVRIHGRQRMELFKVEVNEHDMLKLYTDEEPGASYFDNMGKDKVDIIGEVIGFQVLIDYNELDDRRAQGN